ncbi:ATP-binding sensor histidine kinase [Bacillus suaedae]|uniref:histidine kinase n=1 Tax=Halalkalibacter suaedae TaxID=2822140 RepID=A0A940WVJ5_9BACI|nr:ATP-binding sensor histidine kinase [Bacillus suaedae]MBP3952508.1 AAA family ATPase [Bacillus suaedae]
MKRMPVLADYKIVDIEVQNSTSIMYKGYSTIDNKLVLLKAIRKSNPTPHEMAASIHEFHLTKDLDMDEVIRPIQIEKYLNEPYVVMEYFSGVSLSELLLNEELEIVEALSIAMKITSAMIQLHKYQIIHKNINPENIIFNRTTGQLKITGFDHATKLQRESQRKSVTPFEIEGRLAYISPEQTGRMNRSVDFRSDLYSFGVLLYEMVTGALPFSDNDPMKLLHANLTKVPYEPVARNDKIPAVLSKMIVKLLSKIPEDRYRSAYGLREDLKRCIDQLRLFGKVEDFPLGQDDPMVVFELERKLYGRELEIDKLLASFERVSSGHSELVLIQGHSGIGKTALVNEIQPPLIGMKGYFISGKFDLLQRQKPYSPIIQAFKSLIRQIMTEGDECLQRYRDDIERELTGNVSVITSVIPELKWIVGDSPKEEEISANDAHLRFYLLFQKFVNVFATKDHPLVLFLDDLQWADTASLSLIEYLLTHVDSRYLLLIGAYRDNEIGVEHAFTETIHSLRKDNVTITEISLPPLNEKVILHWVQDTLMDEGIDAKKLARLMFRITQGNPFFMKQLFQSFYENGTILFRIDLGKWIIHFSKVSTTLEKENIVDLMVHRVKQLPLRTQHMLKIASCIGNEFDLKTLSVICDEDPERTGSYLWEALEGGYVLPEDSTYKWIYADGPEQLMEDQSPTYRFLHDRVQQAAYSIMTKEEQDQAHLSIGRLLVELKSVDDFLFDIVNHLNRCRGYLTESEWVPLIEWNVKAGEQAKASAAFKESLDYFQIAYEMLGAAWESNYELTNQLMTGLGECQYLNSQFEEAERTFDKVLENVHTNVERLSIYKMKVLLYTHVHRVDEAVEAGIAGLELVGWNTQRNPSKAIIAKELLLVKLAMRGKKADHLLTLPPLEDQEKRLVLHTMITMNAPSFHVDQNLATILMLRALRFTLKHGITDITSLVCNNYALILSAGFSDFENSYEFGKLAIDLAERSGDVGLKGRVYFVYGSFVNHWKHPIKYNLDYLKWSQQYCIDAGNISLAGANSSFIAIAHFMMGDHLQEVRKGIRKQILFIDQIRYAVSKGFLNEFMYWIDILTNENTATNWVFEQVLEDDSVKIIHYTIRLQLSYLFNKEEYAEALFDHLEGLISNRLTLVIISDYYFYAGLWASRLYQDSSPSRQKILYKRLKRSAKKLREWSKHCPENYLNKWKLLEAELARIDENHVKAVENYDAAITSAKDNNFIKDVAVCNEATGRYYFSKGLEGIGSAYMAEAYRSYIKWGAYAKADMLMKEYEGYIPNINEYGLPQSVAQFDIDASVKASQAILGEIVQENLVKKLMDITMQHAGAERGVLLLKRGDQLLVAASTSVNGEIAGANALQPLEESSGLSTMIVNYVVKSMEATVLNNATVEGLFIDDPYVLTYKPKSILCLPAIYKGKVNSVLYLENNQTTNAFTQDRIRFLSILSTQAAISIENAELYGKLEEKVKERTQEIEQVNQHLEQANKELERAEKQRSHLLSNISHDLRTPIASVKGYIEAILDGVVETEEQKTDFLKKSIDRVDGLNSMINDLFELARLESGQIHFSFDIIPIDRLIKRLKEQLEYDVKRKGLFFTLMIEEINSRDYPMVQVDVKRISQVFSNIISNAIRHTESGGISVSLRFDKSLENAIISITDSGEGISKDQLPSIFDRYFTKSRNGNGLGLAICREIILLHEGEIWAESKLGDGSTFCIQLPVIQVDALF